MNKDIQRVGEKKNDLYICNADFEHDGLIIKAGSIWESKGFKVEIEQFGLVMKNTAIAMDKRFLESKFKKIDKDSINLTRLKDFVNNSCALSNEQRTDILILIYLVYNNRD